MMTFCDRLFRLLVPGLFHVIQVIAQDVQIIEMTHQNRPHFRVITPSATYLFDRAGGGFSSIIDREGRDWTAFRFDSTVSTYPKSAEGQFRGLPNAVFGNADGGVGHAGFQKCKSELVAPNEIATVSHSGKWAWKWAFYRDRAVWTVTKTDPDYAYWFLYEGPIAGTWQPLTGKYWGTDLFLRGEVTDFYQKESLYGKWQWAFFGDRSVRRVLYVAQQHPDALDDTMGFLGNQVAGMGSSPDGMVVFGFGRDSKGKPIMKQLNSFVIGFYEKKVESSRSYRKLSKLIQNQLNQLSIKR